MEAVAIGTLLSSGASAVAGAGTTALTVGSVVGAAGPMLPLASISFGQIAAGFSIAGGAFSFFQGQSAADASYDAALAASRAELQAAQVRASETDLSIQRENTQEALLEAERQRRLRRMLASQRASFAGGAADAFSGSALAIQESTVNEINREARLAGLASEDRVSALTRQRLGLLSQGAGRASSLIGGANINRAGSNLQGLNQLTQIAGNLNRFAGTF